MQATHANSSPEGHSVEEYIFFYLCGSNEGGMEEESNDLGDVGSKEAGESCKCVTLQ